MTLKILWVVTTSVAVFQLFVIYATLAEKIEDIAADYSKNDMDRHHDKGIWSRILKII